MDWRNYMNIDECIKDISRNLSKDYEKSIWIFQKYERILQKEVRENPKNIRAVSLLAIIKCELRKSPRTSLKYLEIAYKNFKNDISNEDLALLSTNIAYFYNQEFRSNEKKMKEILNESILSKTQYAQTYYALALLYYNEDDFSKALPLFKKALELSNNIKNKFNYAVCLYRCGFINKAIPIFLELSHKWEEEDYAAQAYLILGNAYVLNNDTEKAKKIGDELYESEVEVDVGYLDLAELMFYVGDYEKCISFYNKENFTGSVDWLRQYFYSLKELNKKTLATEKLKYVLDEIDEDIQDKQNESADWDKSDLEYYLKSELENKAEIQNAFDDVFLNNIKPKNTFIPALQYVCYYIDCPRHYDEK